MIDTNCPAGSSRRNFSTSRLRAGSTINVSSPKAQARSTIAPGSAAATFSPIVFNSSSIDASFVLRSGQRSIVPVRRIFFCSSSTP